ncbi:MAG: hypothetical protein ACXVDI_26815 [Ktedonobacterales bacterium]
MQCINTIATFRALDVPSALRLRIFEGLPFVRVAGAFGGGSGVPIPGEACVRRRRATM